MLQLASFPLWKLLILTAGGFAAGIINILAGGGSLITIPLLIFLGLPPQVANGTNRIAILMQCVSGVYKYSTKGAIRWKLTLKPVIPAVLGGIAGAYIATILNKQAFNTAVGIILILVLATLFVKTSEWEKIQDDPRFPVWMYPAFFLIGVYGGFIQAGVGFLLLPALVLGTGLSLVHANAIKLVIVLSYTVLALAIFLIQDQAIWIAGVFLGAGNVLGSLVGVRSVFKFKPVFLRWIIIGAVSVTVLKLFGVVAF